jgi:glycosyltransferase involved in cell wall biosynthesis
MSKLITIDARDAVGPQLRGWGRYAACLLEALQRIDLPDIDLDAVTEPGRGPEVLFEQLSLPVQLRRRRSALVHATNCFLPLLRPCPGVVTIQDLAFEAWPSDFVPRTRWKYRVLARAAARSAQRIICPSYYTRDDLSARYGVDPAKVRVIPLAPALPITDEPAPDGPYIVAVGDLRQKKNLRALVSAFAALHRREQISHRLVLAGVDSGQGPLLRGLAGSAPLELTGYLSDAELDALIRGADVLVHPSLYEGFGLVVLEAMARGVPVIAARGTALPQTGGEAALYFDPGRDGGAEALEAVLGPLLRDGDARASRSRAGIAWAVGFSWEQAAEATIEVYRELL